MKIVVEGCAHGELDTIYDTIKEIEEKKDIKVDLLICCGDFQSSRNEQDLKCMAVPEKYHAICSFYKYYNGEKKAPVLTVFIGGNHEASNYLQELPYGGWVAPNIYYLGYAGVIDIAGLRIAGISGIYKGRDFFKGHFEKAPYDENTKRSVYHIRNLEVFRLKQVSQPIDIFLSHDWPTGITSYGNVKQLLKRKPFFEDDINSGQLGSKPCEEILHHMKPKYWFAAHLHCKFAALVKHPDDSTTKFLALDKCLPRRKFLQVLDIPHKSEGPIEISYDLEWLTILYLTNHLLTVKSIANYMPGPGSLERYNFTPTDEEKNLILSKLKNKLTIPTNFRPTAPAYQTNSPIKKAKKLKQPEAKLNPQTTELCEILSIQDPICLVSDSYGLNISLDESFLENTTFIQDSDSELDNSEYSVELNISSQENKIKKLVLPDPKSDKSDETAGLDPDKEFSTRDSENTQCENQENTSVDSTEDVDVIIEKEVIVVENINDSISPKRALSECEKQTDICTVSVSPVEINTPKKFKRRNADMYTNTDS